jgi:PAS domain S-box-containing protein
VTTVVTYWIGPLRPFPLLLAFPAVILTAWFLGMWGGAVCAVTAASLVDFFLTKTQVRFSTGNIREQLRLTTFLAVSILLGWTIRRLVQQRAQLRTEELQRRLNIANAERDLAEERARSSEALRDREQLLQLALQANGMGVWLWDLQQDTMHWSDQIYQMVGREPNSVMPGFEAWLSFILPEDADSVKKAVLHTRASGADYHEQYRVVFPDGSVRWLESQGKCQLDAEGRVTRVLGVMADVTRRKNAEEAMLRTEKLAVAGRLAASVAHEINNPLEAVSNLLYLITLNETADSTREYALLALDELMRVARITQQMLKFHRQDGKPKLTKLSDLVESVLTFFSGKLFAVQIESEVRVEQESMVACMPGEIQQIFANFVSNAIDAMPKGGRIVVRIRPSCDWHDRVTAGMRLTFSDSGAGMDRETQGRIYEPFFTTKPEAGTGLGMWVVAQLVERQKGHLAVWSTQRQGHTGTTFSLFLPFGNESPSVNHSNGEATRMDG